VYVSKLTAGNQGLHAKVAARVRSFRTLAMLSAPFIFGWLRDLEMRYTFAVATLVFVTDALVAFLFFDDHAPAQSQTTKGSDNTPDQVETSSAQNSVVARLQPAITHHFSTVGSSMSTALSTPIMASSFLLGFIRPTMILGPYTIQVCVCVCNVCVQRVCATCVCNVCVVRL